MYQKYGYGYQLFLCLNFPGAAILNVYDVIWLLHCFIQESVDSEQQQQPYYVIKIKDDGMQDIFI